MEATPRAPLQMFAAYTRYNTRYTTSPTKRKQVDASAVKVRHALPDEMPPTGGLVLPETLVLAGI